MQIGFGRAAVFLSLVLMLTSCAGGISRQARDQITYDGPFADVQRDPARYKGETLLLGGKVIETSTRAGATEMVVLQLEIGTRDRPKDNDQSQGRFLVRSAQFIDPAIFPQGTLITVVGRLQGSETRLIGEMSYTYPVMDIREIKKWSPVSDPSPRFHFGIGIGTHF